jgi:hypothetical protein
MKKKVKKIVSKGLFEAIKIDEIPESKALGKNKYSEETIKAFQQSEKQACKVNLQGRRYLSVYQAIKSYINRNDIHGIEVFIRGTDVFLKKATEEAHDNE